MNVKTYTTIAALVMAVCMAAPSDAQRKKAKPDASQSAAVAQTIGAGDLITIAYHRPGLKGRDVWTDKSDNAAIGKLVPWDGDPRPWRAGANEATTFEITADAKIEGKDLPAGKYSLFMIPTDGKWTVVFNTVDKQWGSFRYDKEKDALRVEVTPVDASKEEWLTYGFDNPGAFSCTAYLHWDTKKVPFKIELANQGE